MGIFRKFVHFCNKCKLKRRRFHWTLINNIWKFNVLNLFIKMKIAIEQSTHIFFCILLFLPSHRIGDLTLKEVLNYSETVVFSKWRNSNQRGYLQIGIKIRTQWCPVIVSFIKIRTAFLAPILSRVSMKERARKAAQIDSALQYRRISATNLGRCVRSIFYFQQSIVTKLIEILQWDQQHLKIWYSYFHNWFFQIYNYTISILN